MKISTAIILIAIGLVGCTLSKADLSRHAVRLSDYRHDIDIMWPRCSPLYNMAKTHTDSMIVHTLRPGDTFHDSPTCYELMTELDSLNAGK